MSFRLPGGSTPEEFWTFLAKGGDAISPVPSHRWSIDHTSVLCKDRNVQAGFIKERIDEYDAKFFGISHPEAIDPQQRILHECTIEALEHAGIDPSKLRGTQTGIYVGTWIYHYAQICKKLSDDNFFRAYLGNSISSTAARISHILGTTGPSAGYEAACASSIVALDAACKGLRHGDTTLAIVGGANIFANPFAYEDLKVVLSKDYHCRTFCASSDGFGRGEGVASIVLKRLSDSIKDGNQIWGLIRGSAIVQEGISGSITTPTVHCESLAMKLALKDAGVDPLDVDVIEAHGTATVVGDPIEIKAIEKVYSGNRTIPLFISSVKTNVGHTEALSGLTGIIKVLLAMKYESIPPHINLKTLNPALDLDAIPAKIPTQLESWEKHSERPRLAGVSSFGISGTDGHVIIQEPLENLPLALPDWKLERPLNILVLSGKSPAVLDQIVQKYVKHLNNTTDDLTDIAFSANTGRQMFNHRAVVVSASVTDALQAIYKKAYNTNAVSSKKEPLCLLFTGQGSQYLGMAKTLYKTSPVFQLNFDKCDAILQSRFKISIREVIWGESENELSRTLISQTSIFCVEYCLFKLWKSWGVNPDYVIGHSLGEFCAAVAASILSFDDALTLVAERSRLIDLLPCGKMLVIRADRATVENAVTNYKLVNPNFWIDYAAMNSKQQTVVAGDTEMIDSFKKYCTNNGLKCVQLQASHAFHSRLMKPMLKDYGQVASSIVQLEPNVKDAKPRFISGMEGKLILNNKVNSDYWKRHTIESFNFIGACRAVESEGCKLFLEVGPHPVLSSLTAANIEGATCLSSLHRSKNDWRQIFFLPFGIIREHRLVHKLANMAHPT